MKFKIHGTDSEGNEDSIIVTGGSIEEIQELAQTEVQERKLTDVWSEEVL